MWIEVFFKKGTLDIKKIQKFFSKKSYLYKYVFIDETTDTIEVILNREVDRAWNVKNTIAKFLLKSDLDDVIAYEIEEKEVEEKLQQKEKNLKCILREHQDLEDLQEKIEENSEIFEEKIKYISIDEVPHLIIEKIKKENLTQHDQIHAFNTAFEILTKEKYNVVTWLKHIKNIIYVYKILHKENFSPKPK